MLLPIVTFNAGIGDGISAVDHLAPTDINAHMGGVVGVRRIVSVVEENQVPRFRLGGRDDVAHLP